MNILKADFKGYILFIGQKRLDFQALYFFMCMYIYISKTEFKVDNIYIHS